MSRSMGVFLTAFVWVSLAASAGAQTTPRANFTGPQLYDSACAACHGTDGRGQPVARRGFDIDLPDFTDCHLTTPEADLDWYSIIHEGGRVRGFASMMPAFGDELSDAEIGRVIEHVRGFCREKGWPHGDLNMPRPLVTEKAYPENEAVVTSTFERGTARAISNVFVYERRLGNRGQYEIFARDVDEVGGAYKHVLFDSHRSGSIVSAGGELTVADRDATVEVFAAASQALPLVRDGFMHVHTGIEAPAGGGDEAKELFWRVAAGKTFATPAWGRAWSPMVELLAARELEADAKAEWDAVPQMQVSLSTRQHVLLSAGVRFPITERKERRPAVLVYLLWDWFDGSFWSGW
jgi:mono/diheme cytochrome c family protein